MKKWNRSGYPDGIRGEAIPLKREFSSADIYE